MTLKGDDIALYLSGQSVPIKSCNVIITQPTIKQIVAFGESDFLLAANFLGKPESHISKIREENPDLSKYTDYQIYMALIRQDESLHKCINIFFNLVFPDYKIEFGDDLGFIQNEKRLGMVNPFNFDDFKKIIKELFLSSKLNGQKDYNPANKKAAEIAKKFAKAREKIQKTKGDIDESVTLFGTYTSVLSVGMRMNLNVLYEYTPFQIYNIFSRYWKKVNSDFYQKVSTTPMMDVSKMEEPDDWSANIY